MKRIVAWGPPVLWMVLIFFLSSRSTVSVSEEYILNFLVFKTLHLIEYAALFVLQYRALHATFSGWKAIRIAQVAFGFTVLYAITDELHQTMVPTREGTARDVIIDAFGAGIAWIVLAQLLPKAPVKLRNLAKILQLL